MSFGCDGVLVYHPAIKYTIAELKILRYFVGTLYNLDFYRM
jgi:hypothetical protein